MGAVVLYNILKTLSKKSISVYIFDQTTGQICMQKLNKNGGKPSIASYNQIKGIKL